MEIISYNGKEDNLRKTILKKKKKPYAESVNLGSVVSGNWFVFSALFSKYFSNFRVNYEFIYIIVFTQFGFKLRNTYGVIRVRGCARP